MCPKNREKTIENVYMRTSRSVEIDNTVARAKTHTYTQTQMRNDLIDDGRTIKMQRQPSFEWKMVFFVSREMSVANHSWEIKPVGGRDAISNSSTSDDRWSAASGPGTPTTVDSRPACQCWGSRWEWRYGS